MPTLTKADRSSGGPGTAPQAFQPFPIFSLVVGRGVLIGRPPVRTRAPTQRASPSGLVSARASAARLGIGRDTLGQLIKAKVIERVPRGKGWAFRSADIERLIERGFTLRDSARPKRGQIPRIGSGSVQRIADLDF